MNKLVAIPVTVKAAARFVRAKHRHLPSVTGGLFAVGVGVKGADQLRVVETWKRFGP